MPGKAGDPVQENEGLLMTGGVASDQWECGMRNLWLCSLGRIHVTEEAYGCESQASVCIWRIKENHTSFPKCPLLPTRLCFYLLLLYRVSLLPNAAAVQLQKSLCHCSYRNPGSAVCTAGESLFPWIFSYFYNHFVSFLKPLPPPLGMVSHSRNNCFYILFWIIHWVEN